MILVPERIESARTADREAVGAVVVAVSVTVNEVALPTKVTDLAAMRFAVVEEVPK